MTVRPLPENAHLIPESAKLVFKGTLFDTYQWQQKMFDGSFQTFEMLRRPDTALVIAIDNDHVVLLNEEQPGGVVQNGRLPGGRIEPGEDPLEGAKREIVEELGETYEKWALLEVKQPAIKIEWFTYVYVAVNKIAEQPTAHEVGEKIEIKRVSFEEFKESQEFQGQKGHILEGINSIDDLLEKVNFEVTKPGGKLKKFIIDGESVEVNFVETQSVKEGVDGDIYTFANDSGKDLGIFRVQKGYKTPLQRVVLGNKTIEGFISGSGTLTVDDKVYMFGPESKEKEVTVNVGQTMQYNANNNSDLTFYEICEPPYSDGRFENLPELSIDRDAAIRIIQHVGTWMRDNNVPNYSKWWDPNVINADFLSKYAKPDEFYVLTIESQPAAATIIQKEQSLQDWSSVDTDGYTNAIYLHYVAVERQFAGKGLVTYLVEKAEELAKQKGISKIRLDTDANEPKLCQLYESFGFVCIKKIQEDAELIALYEKSI